MCIEELQSVADHLHGSLQQDNDGQYWIRVDTDDNTAKENYDDLLDLDSEIERFLTKYEVSDKWADHNTQIIEFTLIEDNLNSESE